MNRKSLFLILLILVIAFAAFYIWNREGGEY